MKNQNGKKIRRIVVLAFALLILAGNSLGRTGSLTLTNEEAVPAQPVVIAMAD